MTEGQEKILTLADSITVGELAENLNLSVTKLVGELFKNGIVATINQRIDFETAEIIIEELGLDVKLVRREVAAPVVRRHVLSDDATPRPPIVAVMGHVDHGKTSLLDAVLDKKVVEGEAGGITQHISAYQTIRNQRPITLLDTPGHEAFAALRQHGAVLTDVVIIVVAADDGVMPQTVEAIRFARNANAKMVVAINKIDKETANPGMVMGQLAEHGVIADQQGWGGDVPMVEVSAKTGQGIENLLDTVLLVADMEELRADIDTPAEGLVIEAHMETGRGAVAGLLVEQGQLRKGQFLVAGTVQGKVRTLLDYKGDELKEAGPSTPITVTGFKEVPQFGDRFEIAKNEREARQIVERNRQERERVAASTNVTGADLLKMMTQKHDSEEFNVIVKADVQGSLTSVIDSLKLIDTGGDVTLRVISSGVGSITENDIRLGVGDKQTVVYGFNVNLPPAVKRLAQRDRVEVRIYNVIYELLDDAKNSMSELLAPEVVETEIGELGIKGVFRTVKENVICGGEVLSGKAVAGVLVRIKRGKETIGEAEVEHVQRQQVEAKEVFEGEMCGLSLKTNKKVALEVGDKLEFFTRELVKRSI
jgi:translation initiation factor IF-2